MSRSINLHRQIIEQPSMVVLIDCWKNTAADNIAGDIVNFCVTNPWVKIVALATYSDELGPYFSPHESPWYENTRRIFFQESHWQDSRLVWKKSTFLQNVQSFTNPLIAKMPDVPGQVRIQAQSMLYLLYYLNSVDTTIRNVYYLGGGWDQCLKWRPVGWFQMVAMNQCKLLNNPVNILTHEKCIYGENTKPDFKPKDAAWGRLDKNIFLLNQKKVDLTDLSDPNLPENYITLGHANTRT